MNLSIKYKSLIFACAQTLIIALFVFITGVVSAQNATRKILNFPDIAGYKTLKCDFHTHTVFSDGTVWPAFRVEEAWSDGLDVIALTDHLGHHVKNNVNPADLNTPYNDAKLTAEKLGIVLIKGSELTRKMPPGHINMLFLKDVNPLDTPDYKDVLKIAEAQGAYFIWNHPGWKQPGDTPVWYNEHEQILKNGWMDGIEIVNYKDYYPLAHTWALQKNLTLFANSDSHDPAATEFDYMSGNHRPMTLVFSKDTAQASIKEALTQHRTVAYYKNFLYGSETYLQQLFNASVTILSPQITIYANSKDEYYNTVKIQNNSCMDYEIKLIEKNKDIRADNVVLKANSITRLEISAIPKDLEGKKDYKLKYAVTNLLKSPQESIVVEIPLSINFLKR